MDTSRECFSDDPVVAYVCNVDVAHAIHGHFQASAQPTIDNALRVTAAKSLTDVN